MGFPSAPLPLGASTPFQLQPDFRRMVSPGAKVKLFTLSRVCQALSGEMPVLLSLPFSTST